MDIKNKLNKGELLSFQYNSKYYIYLRSVNQVLEIKENIYKYINSSLPHKINSIIEDQTLKNIPFINEDKVSPNVYINAAIKEKETKALIIKQILEYYNISNNIYLILEINQETLDLIDELTEWINGFNRVIIICCISEDKKYLLEDFKIKNK